MTLFNTYKNLYNDVTPIEYLEDFPQLDDSNKYLQEPSQWDGSIEYLEELPKWDDSIKCLQGPS